MAIRISPAEDLRLRVCVLEEIVAKLIVHQHYFVASSSDSGDTTTPTNMDGVTL